jgi:hypothetical protein
MTGYRAPHAGQQPHAADVGKAKAPADARLHAQDGKKAPAADAKKTQQEAEKQKREKAKERKGGRDGDGGDRDAEAARERELLAAPYKPATYDEMKHDSVAALLQRRETSMNRLQALERREARARKGPPPVLPRTKGHWDYVLDEMQWMAIDFRQVRADGE